MKEEKIKILKMLEEKKITSEEAAQLLETLEKTNPENSSAEKGKNLRIRVFEGDLAKAKVNINIPLSWYKFLSPVFGGKIKSKLTEKGINIDMDELLESVEKGETGKIIDINDGNDKVEIYID